MSLPDFPIIDDASPRRRGTTARRRYLAATALSAGAHASGYGGYVLVVFLAAWLGFTPPQLLTRSRQASIELQASIAAAPKPSEAKERVRTVKMPVAKPQEKPVEPPAQIAKADDTTPAKRPTPLSKLISAKVQVTEPEIKLVESMPEETPPETEPEQKPARSKTVAAAVAPIESVRSAASVAVEGSQFDEPPQPDIYNRKPPYPADARARRLQGVVLLRLTINAEGFVDDVVVTQSSGFSGFDDSARRTALAWRFTPARLLGRNVMVVMEHVVRFTFRDST